MMRRVVGWTVGFPGMDVSRCRTCPVPYGVRLERVFGSLLFFLLLIGVRVVRIVWMSAAT